VAKVTADESLLKMFEFNISFDVLGESPIFNGISQVYFPRF
jgi:hypothetical protein